MPVTLTFLVDNSAHDPRLAAEHGLAIWIEAHGTRILLDAGQTGAVVANAEKLGVPLERADFIVLSHGHYDHSGGLRRVLEVAPGAILCLHPAATRTRYSTRAPAAAHPVGMPVDARESLGRAGSRIRWVREPAELVRGVGLTGAIPRVAAWEDVGGLFTLDPFAKLPDDIVDDLALWIDTPGGFVVVTGCAHAGLVNTLDFIGGLHAGQRVAAIVGGFHLRSASDDRLERTHAAVVARAPAFIVPAHCTGERGTAMLRAGFPAAFRPAGAGTRIEV